MKEVVYKPIGIVESPYASREGMPIQATGGQGVRGRIRVFEEYVEGLQDLDGFSHIILI